MGWVGGWVGGGGMIYDIFDVYIQKEEEKEEDGRNDENKDQGLFFVG